MSWGLGWKRSFEIFHLTLDYGDYDGNKNSPPTRSNPSLGVGRFLHLARPRPRAISPPRPSPSFRRILRVA